MYYTLTPSGIKGIPLLVFMQIPPAHPPELCPCSWNAAGGGDSLEQLGDSSELSHMLCHALWALHPRTGTVGRDFFPTTQFIFLQLDRLGLVQVF